MDIDKHARHNRRRVGNRGATSFESHAIDIIDIAENMVLAKCGISTQREPLRSLHRKRKFDTSTIGVLHIAREEFARIREFTRLHQLVAIEHII